MSPVAHHHREPLNGPPSTPSSDPHTTKERHFARFREVSLAQLSVPVAPPTIAALEPPPKEKARRHKNKPLPTWRLIVAAAGTLAMALLAIRMLDPNRESSSASALLPTQTRLACPRWLMHSKSLPLLPGPTDSYSRAKLLRERRQRLLSSALAAADRVHVARADNASALWGGQQKELLHLYRLLQDGRCVAESRAELVRMDVARTEMTARLPDLSRPRQPVSTRHNATAHVRRRSNNATVPPKERR